jgi:beta-lactamase regulating signal transducer with metallopeptidase domain
MPGIPSEPLAGFFSWLTRSSAQTGVLICLILAVQVVLRSRLAPRWRYALWLLVIVRLALPWGPESSLSVFNLYRLAEANASRQAAPAESHGVASPVLSVESALLGDDQPVELSAAGAAGGETVTVGKPSRIDIRPWLIPLAWLIGALTVMTCAAVESVSLASAVRRRRLVTDQKTLDLLEDCKAELGVHSYLAVVETPRVRSPALFGFVRPCLLLPPGAIESLGRERMRHVFLHELTHLRRHDIAANWLMTLLQALHWFNPLVWYGFYRMRADRELARDAAVLARFRPEELPQYGMTIVHLLETFSQRRRVPCLAGVLEDKRLIKRRIEMIASFKQSPSRWSIPAVALMVALGALTFTNAQQPAATSTAAPQSGSTADLNAKVAQLDINKATIDDVVRVFGEPRKYVWGSEETGATEIIKKADLPSRQCYIADYGKGFRIFMRNGQIMELRFEGNREYSHKGRLRVGDSLDDALKAMGTPKETVTGAARSEIFGKDNVLYRDIDGQKGFDYYLRKDKGLRVFFRHDNVRALYVIRSDFFDSPADAPASRSPTRCVQINAQVAKLDIDKATLDDVIRLFGKPQRYIWGNQVIAEKDLADQDHYVADFGEGFHIFMK